MRLADEVQNRIRAPGVLTGCERLSPDILKPRMRAFMGERQTAMIEARGARSYRNQGSPRPTVRFSCTRNNVGEGGTHHEQSHIAPGSRGS
jgi:hypothetical protein